MNQVIKTKTLFLFLMVTLLSVNISNAAERDGGRTGVGGGIIEASRIKSLMKYMWTVFLDASEKGDLDLLPLESSNRVKLMLEGEGESIKVEVRKAVYVKTNIADKSTQLISREEYALQIIDQNPAVRVRELPVYIYRRPESDQKKIVLVFSESIWESLDKSQRISLIFSQNARLAGMNAKIAKELSLDFMKWLKTKPEIESDLVSVVR